MVRSIRGRLEPKNPEAIDGFGALCFSDVVYRYGDHVALDHLNLQVACGEMLGVLGPNGAGKSTTMSILLGLLRPQSGTVRVLGTSPRQAMADGRVGAMLQQGSGNGLPPGLRVGTVVNMVRQLYPHPAPLEVLVELTGIRRILNSRTNGISGGEAQRIHFAIAIAGNPELVFLDEPTAAMDVESRNTFWRMARQLSAEGRTVVFATHHMDEAEHADRVVVINRGRVVAEGPTATLKAAVTTRRLRFVAEDADLSVLDQLEGVTDVEMRGTGIVLNSLDADATVRDLVHKRVPFCDLEVTGARLEEAFIALTTDDPAPEKTR